MFMKQRGIIKPDSYHLNSFTLADKQEMVE